MASRLPLNAMQAFEAAARRGSFAAAAQDLAVTAAAVSQHVRQLETRFGKQLFVRHAHGVELSDAGRELFLRVSGAFAELSQAAAHLRTAASRPRAVISVIASVDELWLLPCLAEWGNTAGIQIIEDLQDPVDFTTRDVDLRITYGALAYPQHPVDVLFHDRMLPVAAPGLAAAWADGPALLRDGPLIHTVWGPAYGHPQSWARWHESQGSPDRPDVGQGMAVERMGLAAEAARQGLGVALLPETLAAADLSRGSLVAVGPAAARMPLPYVIVRRPGPRQRPAAESIWRHLLAKSGVGSLEQPGNAQPSA